MVKRLELSKNSYRTRRARTQQALGALVSRGYSLLELTLTIALIGLAAAVAVPSVTTGEQKNLDLALQSTAESLRYARQLSSSTGEVHGVSVDTDKQTLRLFRIDSSVLPEKKIYDVRHPITKQLYTIMYDQTPYAGVSILARGGVARATCVDSESISFDAYGVVRCANPTTELIDSVAVTLITSNRKVSVTVENYTGRVEQK